MLAVAGGMGWYKIGLIKKQNSLNEELELCKSWINTGQHPKAQASLERILRENPRLKEAGAVLATLAESYEATGDTAKAAVCWQKLYADHPDSNQISRALVAIADKHLRDGDRAKAVEFWNMVLEKFAESEHVDDALFGKAKLLYQDGEDVKTRDALWTLLEEYPESNRLAEIEKLLGTINMDLLFSRNLIEGEGSQIYKVVRGDTLDGIGRRYKISSDLLAKINRIANVHALSIGKRLIIPSVGFSIEVDKSDNTLVLYNRDRFFKRYRVRTGEENWLTPPGSFTILKKVRNPTWNEPGGKHHAAGSPENALGSRWMAFEGMSLGIHGTNKPETIGQYASKGCVGLLNEDVEELYDLVPLGTKVEIKGKMITHGKKRDL